ncbi:multidrug resistance-associated ABC transporter [Mycena alexandri]|uniref:Multidrug resistance-associated ABC transporter n=1 Tax=Mycena alexandri TaxID=1745969 RepID=A0AAD6TAX3_9AGAR|nr:multidrug resistance-associated ABC transporter [Mycena alexandri]
MERGFGIALVLTVLGSCSAVGTAYRWMAHGEVALPLEEDLEPEQSSIHAGVFDIARPDDFIDGHPLDEAAFWTRMRPRKLALVLILLTGLVFIASVTDGKTGYSEVVSIAFAAYLSFVAAVSVSTTDRTDHAYYTTTLAVLSASALIILSIDALIPSSSPSQPHQHGILTLAFYLVVSSLTLTMPRGPQLDYPPENIYSEQVVSSGHATVNVNGVVDASAWGALFFSYISKVATLSPGFGVADLPLLTADMRALVTFSQIRASVRRTGAWHLPAGMRFGFAVLRANALQLVGVQLLSAITAVGRCSPPYFMRLLLIQLEGDTPIDKRWGLVYVAGLLAGNLVFALGWGQIWNLAHIAGIRIVSQTTTLLFVKTLVRKEAAIDSATAKPERGDAPLVHKAQILTLMSQDVHRVSDLSKHVYTLTDSPIQLVLSTWILYSLLGTSCFVGLAATMICLPLQHFTGNIIFRAQKALMRAKDERITLTNEILGGIRMVKFMAWERKFEARIWEIREKELVRQKITYAAKTLLTAVGNSIPLLFALASFGHYTIIRHQNLTPSIAFTAITIFNTMQYAISGFPEALIAGLQCLISLRRIDQFLESPEVSIPVQSSRNHRNTQRIFLSSASVSWPLSAQSQSNTPFTLSDLSLEFPIGELSLICGKVGSGKTLLLLALLGEAEITAGQVECPRSAPDFLASFGKSISPDEWVVPAVCAYVPQTSWLRNQSIRDNILFELPYSAERYMKTLEVCALVPDLEMLEYGDLSEVGERGINLSGGQKARVSLARAVYSRASILILDDILSAVDVHTGHHIYNNCIKGDIMRGRTVILVSHHIQLCADGAAYVVAIDRGTAKFRGGAADFRRSDIFRSLIQTKLASASGAQTSETTVTLLPTSKPAPDSTPSKTEKVFGKAPKFVADELSSVGRIPWAVWTTYLRAAGEWKHWVCFTIIMIISSLGPVFENSYLRTWADAGEAARYGPIHYLTIYAAIMCIDLLFRMAHFSILYSGSIRASQVLYKKLLETVLFSPIKFHDTAARGILLNRFGRDFQIIDGFIADDFARAAKLGLSVIIIFVTITFVGGLPFLCAAAILGLAYYLLAQDYAHTSRDMRRLVSTTTSPLYSIYETAISGALVIRSFGASTTFLRDLMRSMDANSCACHWQYGLNRWFSVLSMTFSGTIVALIGLVILLSPAMDPSLAGMALVFASMVSADLMYFVRAFVGLEQCLVAVERVKETSDLVREPPEMIEPRPPVNWPSRGQIVCQDLSVRYSPELPDVLHGLNFQVSSGEKIGIVGRTGSGKTTLALYFFQFVEASEGKLLIDGIDIASLGLTDLRRNLTIIPQDPTLMSGTLRSTLDVFNEHQDAEIFEALRSVHLISQDPSDNKLPTVFSNLDSPVSQAGSNFSAGEKQLLCLARAILKHAKVLILDEATASVDYATDELVGLTIREKFSSSTILTIAHRLRSVIDYDKVMVLEEGRIVEFESPKTLLENESSKFYALCKATGSNEFATLQSMAEI